MGYKMEETHKRAWAQILLAFLTGILLIFYKQEWRLADQVHHVGTAFIVAAIVTAFWHLREVSEIINKYVGSILVDYSFLAKLELSALMELRSIAARAIIEKNADNPRYKRAELETGIDKLLYERLLPGKNRLSGIYREDYDEDIVVEYETLAEALSEVGAVTDGISEGDLKAFIMKVTTTVQYEVISPRVSDRNYSKYEFTYSTRLPGVANFPKEKLLSILVGNDEKSAVALAVDPKMDKGQVLFLANPTLLDFEEGTCSIWMVSVEYKSPVREPFVLNTMSYLTRGLRASIRMVGKGPSLVFAGQMIATPLNKPTEGGSGVNFTRLKYDGWLFEDHGYHFYWWTEEGDQTLANSSEKSAVTPCA